MDQTLHPHYLKHMIHGGDIPIREKTGAQMVAEIRKNGPADLPADQKTRTGDGPRYCRRHRVGQAGDTWMDGLYDALEGRWQLEDSLCGAAHRLVRRVPDCVFRNARSPERGFLFAP